MTRIYFTPFRYTLIPTSRRESESASVNRIHIDDMSESYRKDYKLLPDGRRGASNCRVEKFTHICSNQPLSRQMELLKVEVADNGS